MATKTTTTYICDRCGAESTDQQSLVSIQVYGYSKIRIGTNDYGCQKFDICRDCEQSLIRWADVNKDLPKDPGEAAIDSVNAFIRDRVQ